MECGMHYVDEWVTVRDQKGMGNEDAKQEASEGHVAIAMAKRLHDWYRTDGIQR